MFLKFRGIEKLPGSPPFCGHVSDLIVTFWGENFCLQQSVPTCGSTNSCVAMLSGNQGC